jgi:hypothetical protein
MLTDMTQARISSLLIRLLMLTDLLQITDPLTVQLLKCITHVLRQQIHDSSLGNGTGNPGVI